MFYPDRSKLKGCMCVGKTEREGNKLLQVSESKVDITVTDSTKMKRMMKFYNNVMDP
jgi:hypothetical protein